MFLVNVISLVLFCLFLVWVVRFKIFDVLVLNIIKLYSFGEVRIMILFEK